MLKGPGWFAILTLKRAGDGKSKTEIRYRAGEADDHKRSEGKVDPAPRLEGTGLLLCRRVGQEDHGRSNSRAHTSPRDTTGVELGPHFSGRKQRDPGCRSRHHRPRSVSLQLEIHRETAKKEL